MLRSIRIPVAMLVLGIVWAIFSDPLITLLFPNLSTAQQDTYRSANDFVFVIGISLFVYITIRRQQQMLSKSEEQYRNLFESNPNPMWIYDIETYKFIKVNNAALGAYGYNHNEFLNMSIYDIRPESEREKVDNFINEPHNGVKHAGVWEHMKANGLTFKVSIISHPVTFGNKKCSLVMANDVTELMDKRERLKDAYKKIRKHNKLLLDINWSNSHEMRKPLCSIISLVDMLKTTENDQEKTECLNYLSKCSAELDHVSKKNNDRLERIGGF